jgi:protein ImuB
LEPALAIAEASGNRRWISLANPVARAKGLAPRQPVATAFALCPELILFERDAADEQKALEEAALAALRFTPSVTFTSGGVLMEVAASLRLFGGQEALLEKIQQAFKDLGLKTALGIAPTAKGACLLALAAKPGTVRSARPAELKAQLDALPVRLLTCAQDHLPVLTGIGCTRLGDLEGLPRAGLARRFGPALLAELDQAYGKRPEPQVWFCAPERFAARLELIARVESTEALLFAVRRLTTQLAGWLVARHVALSQLTLTLHHAAWGRLAQAQTPVIVRLSQPCRDPQHLEGLLRERCNALVLTAPVEELSLAADELTLAAVPNQELFPTPQSEALTLERLVEKLRARLGPDAVQQVESRADHRPERAWRHGLSRSTPHALLPTTLAPRPTWLLKIPKPLPIREHRPCHDGPLALLAGPERIEAGWWDDAPITRDYYIAENPLGQLLWIYRERKAPSETSAWFLHGLFS